MRFKLAGFEGAAEVVCFGLLLMRILLLVEVLLVVAASTDCDLLCNITASFPSGMVAAVEVGSVWLLR